MTPDFKTQRMLASLPNLGILGIIITYDLCEAPENCNQQSVSKYFDSLHFLHQGRLNGIANYRKIGNLAAHFSLLLNFAREREIRQNIQRTQARSGTIFAWNWSANIPWAPQNAILNAPKWSWKSLQCVHSF